MRMQRLTQCTARLGAATGVQYYCSDKDTHPELDEFHQGKVEEEHISSRWMAPGAKKSSSPHRQKPKSSTSWLTEAHLGQATRKRVEGEAVVMCLLSTQWPKANAMATFARLF